MTFWRNLILTSGVVFSVAAGDGDGRYQLHSLGRSCRVGPCAGTKIVDRVTGRIIYGDVAVDRSQLDATGSLQISGADWDLVVDGQIRQDTSTRDIPVLRITKVVGRSAPK